MDDSAMYYVRRRGRTEGPWPVSKLRSEIALHKLGRHHEVSSDGTSWRRAGELAELFPVETRRKQIGKPLPVPADAGADGTDGATWYYCGDDDSQVGPVSVGSIVEAINSGQCPLDVLVWRNGFGDWLPVEDVPEIMMALDAQQATGGSHTAATRMVQTAVAAARDQKPIVALVVGAVTLLMSCIPFFGFAGVAAVVLGVLAVREVRQRGGSQRDSQVAVAGIVAGSLAVLFALFLLLLLIILYFVW